MQKNAMLLLSMAAIAILMQTEVHAINEFTIDILHEKVNIDFGEKNQTFLQVRNNEDVGSQIYLKILSPSSAPEQFWIYFEKDRAELAQELEFFLEGNEETSIPITFIGGKPSGTLTLEVLGVMQAKNFRDRDTATVEFVDNTETTIFTSTPGMGWASFFILSLGAALFARKKDI